MSIATVSDVLTRAAALLDRGVCRSANARLASGHTCSVFHANAASYSMYGALCSVLGPGLGGDAQLQHSAAWKLIALRAWDALPADSRTRMEYALHDLNDQLPGHGGERQPNTMRGNLFRAWAKDPEIIAMGAWK